MCSRLDWLLPYYRSFVSALYENRGYKGTTVIEKSKEDKGAFAASPLHNVQFYNRTIQMGGYVLLKVKICTSHTTAWDFWLRPLKSEITFSINQIKKI